MSLLDLSNEVILIIATHIQSEKDISSLVRASRFFYNLLNNYLYRQNIDSGASALSWCAEHGVENSIRRLLELQAHDKTENRLLHYNSFNFVDSPLRSAICYHHASIVKLLLEYGAGKTCDFPISTPLHTAVHYGTEEVVRIILEHGSDIDLITPRGQTALVVAVREQRPEIVKLLLNYGACLNTEPHVPAEAQRYEGLIWATPLHTAVDEQCGNRDMAELLLSYGADVNVRRGDGGTPLHWTTSEINVDESRWLLENGADPNILDDKGCSPFHCALDLGAHGAELVKLLLDHGANPNLKRRVTPASLEPHLHPLQILDGMDCPDIEKLLRDYGAKLPESA